MSMRMSSTPDSLVVADFCKFDVKLLAVNQVLLATLF
jgi:hypothetical protein